MKLKIVLIVTHRDSFYIWGCEDPFFCRKARDGSTVEFKQRCPRTMFEILAAGIGRKG